LKPTLKLDRQPLLEPCCGHSCVGALGWGYGRSVGVGVEAGQEATAAELELVVGGDPSQLRGQLVTA
jgi:hypothetical protein